MADKELSKLADSVKSAHRVADEILETIEESDGDVGQWNARMAESEPTTVYEDASGEGAGAMIVRELPDESAATYVLRELWERGLAVEADEDDHGRFVFVFPGAASTSSN